MLFMTDFLYDLVMFFSIPIVTVFVVKLIVFCYKTISSKLDDIRQDELKLTRKESWDIKMELPGEFNLAR